LRFCIKVLSMGSMGAMQVLQRSSNYIAWTCSTGGAQLTSAEVLMGVGLFQEFVAAGGFLEPPVLQDALCCILLLL
jgi:hypothetical protein